MTVSLSGLGVPRPAASAAPPVYSHFHSRQAAPATWTSAAEAKLSLPSAVSCGLLPAASLSPVPFYASGGSVSGGSVDSSSIAHIPLSLARRHLSSISSESVGHRVRQQALVAQLTGAFVSWQQQSVDEYCAIVQRCKREASERIERLNTQKAEMAAAAQASGQTASRRQSADDRENDRSPSDSSNDADREQTRPHSMQVAPQTVSVNCKEAASDAAVAAAATVHSPADLSSDTVDSSQSALQAATAAEEADWKSASKRQQEAAHTVQQLAAEVGLRTLPADCLLPLESLHSRLSPWMAARSTLAARVANIKQTQTTLQAEKSRLTAWKDAIKQQQQQQQQSSSGGSGGTEQLAEESVQWEAAKQKLAADGARLKQEHAEYERRIAEYKAEEAAIKQSWSDIGRLANPHSDTQPSSEAAPLPSADQLSALVNGVQRLTQSELQLAHCNERRVAALTTAQQRPHELQAQHKPHTALEVTMAAARTSAAGDEGDQLASLQPVLSPAGHTTAALTAAERTIADLQTQLTQLSLQLEVALQAEKKYKASSEWQPASDDITRAAEGATAYRAVPAVDEAGQIQPVTSSTTLSPSSPALPFSSSSPSPCSSCDGLLARCASLQTSLSQCAADLSATHSLLSTERGRHSAVESSWLQQQSVYSASAAGASGKADAEIARYVQQAGERQLQLEDLSRLLDETVRKANRELNDTRASQQRLMEEAVSTLERQQANERQQWTQQLEASIAAADDQSKARQAAEVRLAAEERKWREADAQLTQQRAAFDSLRAEAAEALQTRDALLAQLHSATADIERLHGVIESERSKAAAAESDRLSMFGRLLEEQKRRKEFQFKYEDAKGKVRVYARVRPFTAAEVSAREKTLLRPGRNDWTLELNETQRDVLGHISDKWREFAFDHVFHPGLAPDTKGNGSQAEVFEETASFAELSLQGINCCIFAYGQSGTGQDSTTHN